MAQIFKNPGDLVVQIGKDILINKSSIKSDIDTSVADFKTGLYLESGEALGDAIALVFFGRGGRRDGEFTTMPEESYNSYLAVSGFAQAFEVC